MRQQVFFTFYDIPQLQNKTFEEACARCMESIPHRFIRLEIENTSDGIEIKSVGFVSKESLEAERIASAGLAHQMGEELKGVDITTAPEAEITARNIQVLRMLHDLRDVTPEPLEPSSQKPAKPSAFREVSADYDGPCILVDGKRIADPCLPRKSQE